MIINTKTRRPVRGRPYTLSIRIVDSEVNLYSPLNIPTYRLSRSLHMGRSQATTFIKTPLS